MIGRGLMQQDLRCIIEQLGYSKNTPEGIKDGFQEPETASAWSKASLTFVKPSLASSWPSLDGDNEQPLSRLLSLPPTRPPPPPQPSHLRIRRTLTYRYLQCWSDMFVSLRLTPPPPNPGGGLEHTRKTHTWPGTCSWGIRPNGDEVKREVREVREVTSSPPGL